jgi:pyrroline-5-carboxylate reductase
MTLGFIGTGQITSAIVTGMASSDGQFQAINVSPRNHQIAANLSHCFPSVSIASSNQAVLDSSDTVVVAVRPPIAREILSELRFRPDHRVISVVSGLSLKAVSGLVAPAARITRAVPLPSTAKRIGPTTIYPPDPVVRDIFAALGTAIEVETEAEFDAICAATATVAAFYTFLDEIASWLSSHGIPEAKSRDYIARLFLAEISTASELPEEAFRSLAQAHTTAGGINEQFLRFLSERGLWASMREGLDAVLMRIRPVRGK